jgi:hypothetical protein
VMVVVGRTIKSMRGRWTRQQANLEEQRGGQWEISFLSLNMGREIVNMERKKKGMELREKNGTEKRTGVEVEKESIERKCPDSENSSSQPFCLNLAEKRKKKDMKEDELAEERAGRTPSSENSVFAHPRKFRKEKRTKKVSFSKLEREASDIGNKCVEEVPSSKLKRKIENSDGLEALLVKEMR